jgi:hypothetical protein
VNLGGDEAMISNPALEKLLNHVGHNIEIATYGKDAPVNVSIECIDCYEVIYDVDVITTKEK